MSGGHFDYAYSRTRDFADQLEADLESNSDFVVSMLEQEERLRPALEKTAKIANLTAKLMCDAEWLFSGDTSEDIFLRQFEEFGNEMRNLFSK